MGQQAWDRQRDEQGNLEPMFWFRRFERYRLMGPGRSLLGMYNAEREKVGKSRAKRTPSSWNAKAREWNWKERTEAWDAHEAARERAEREAEERQLREQAREVRRNLLSAGHNLLARAIQVYLMGEQGVAPDSQAVQRLLSAITRFNADSREEYGDLPARDVNVRGKDGGPVAVVALAATLEDLSDDELRRIIGLDPDGTTSGAGDPGPEGGEAESDGL